MTQEIEIDPQTAEPVYDLKKELQDIHICLQQLKKALLPDGGLPWTTTKPPQGSYPGSDYGYGPGVPDDSPKPGGNVTPVGIIGTTVLEPLVVPPVAIGVNRTLPISFRLFEKYPFFSSPYVGTTVTVSVDTAPFGGVANIGLPGGGTGLTLTGVTDAAGVVTFTVIGLGVGAASLVATALSLQETVSFNVS